jgi:hypothetical protein
MTHEMVDKLSIFIDDLLEFKSNDLVFDIFPGKKKRETYYTFDIDTQIGNSPLTTEFLHFAVCPQTGLVLLHRNGYEEFRSNDVEFAKKYAKKIEDTNNIILMSNLEKIIDTSYKDLKMTRQNNIKKLIG